MEPPHPMKALGQVGRAAAFVVLSLGVWWFLFRPVTAEVLRRLAYVPMAMVIAPAGLAPIAVSPETGEWIFNVALDYDGIDPANGQAQHIASLEFAAEPGTAGDFTAGWFSYIGLTLAVGGFRRTRWLTGVKGLMLQLGLSVFALTAFVYVSAMLAVAGPGTLRDGLRVADYILSGVVPMAGPFAVALLVHPEWRAFFHSKV